MDTLDDLDPRLAPGGVISRRALLSAGLGEASVRALRRSGRLTVLRRGWYALPGADALVCDAVTSGGVLACASALEYWGAWRPLPTAVTHTRRSAHLRRSSPAHLQVCRARVEGEPRLAVDPAAQALLSATRCLTPEDLVAVMDSLVDRRIMSERSIEQALHTAPLHVRALTGRMGSAQSGSESLVRFRLTGLGFTVRSQVWLTPDDRVDLLVGRWLVIEVDGERHHNHSPTYSRDRDRDRRLAALGYVVLRLTWTDVHLGWPHALEQITSLTAHGVHRRGLWVQRASSGRS